jgi:hypothetical protein
MMPILAQEEAYVDPEAFFLPRNFVLFRELA